MACGQEARSVTPGRSVCERHPHYTPSNMYMKGAKERKRQREREGERHAVRRRETERRGKGGRRLGRGGGREREENSRGTAGDVL